METKPHGLEPPLARPNGRAGLPALGSSRQASVEPSWRRTGCGRRRRGFLKPNLRLATRGLRESPKDGVLLGLHPGGRLHGARLCGTLPQ